MDGWMDIVQYILDMFVHSQSIWFMTMPIKSSHIIF